MPASTRAGWCSERRRTRGPRTKTRAPGRAPHGDGPLLVIDGDSFAHRAYHALPKTILRPDGKQAGAILGFANMLLRFCEAEHPRAVLVAWDTLDAPTYRNKMFPAYQSGRTFDAALIEQLKTLPQFIEACGFANAKAPGFEADDFLAAAVAAEEKRKGTVLVASGDRDTFQLAREDNHFPVRAGRWHALIRTKSEALRRGAAAGAGSSCAAIHPTTRRARPP